MMTPPQVLCGYVEAAPDPAAGSRKASWKRWYKLDSECS